MPLIVMLHGCTQNAADFATGTQMDQLAQQHGCFVWYPEQSLQKNAQGCWNWFESAHQVRDQGEPMLIADGTRQIVQQHGIDAGRIFIAGLSAGGAMAALVADCYPELYSAVGIHSGLPPRVASNMNDAFSAMKGRIKQVPPISQPTPTIVFHGSEDRTVHPINAEHIMQRLKNDDCAIKTDQDDIRQPGRRLAKVTRQWSPDGSTRHEYWKVVGAGHAWSGGDGQGSHTDPSGPDASAEMLRFFLQHNNHP